MREGKPRVWEGTSTPLSGEPRPPRDLLPTVEYPAKLEKDGPREGGAPRAQPRERKRKRVKEELTLASPVGGEGSNGEGGGGDDELSERRWLVDGTVGDAASPLAHGLSAAPLPKPLVTTPGVTERHRGDVALYWSSRRCRGAQPRLSSSSTVGDTTSPLPHGDSAAPLPEPLVMASWGIFPMAPSVVS
ncbi:hypothetical protein Sjap_018171 [Stephania japonica]|uniref:Uncharacterized protein n=1 Tax=Stephania japonica TaxID=461633 RepID=A0AAP0NMV7_9MAGN